MQTYIICYRQRYGRHSDPYCDFEDILIRKNKWIRKNESNKILKKLFLIFVLPILKKRKLFFNFKINLLKDKSLFALLSGIEYSKIFTSYFQETRLKSIYMFDPWPIVNNVNLNAFKSFKINIAFFPTKSAVDFFNNQNLDKFKAFYIPEGVDSTKYKYKDYDEKDIDILQFGRKWDWLHNKIKDKIRINNIKYIYPVDNYIPLFPKRNDFVSALSRAKIVICVPRAITNDEQMKGMSTLTTRYFESMSSKALIWGIAPNELIELFGFNPVITIDKNDPFGQLCDILKNYNQYFPLIEKNYNIVMNNHQWSNRASEINDILEKYVGIIGN